MLYFFSENFARFEIMWRNMVEPDSPQEQNKIQRIKDAI